MPGRRLSEIIKHAQFFREKSDYEDFFVAGEPDAAEQLENARFFIQAIEEYLEGHTE